MDMSCVAIPPSHAPLPNGDPILNEKVVGTCVYSHPHRGPMYLEFGENGGLRCTCIVWYKNSFRLRRTQFCDGKYYQHKEHTASLPNMQLIFSCRLKPGFFPTVQFEWDAVREIWKNDENGVELEEATSPVIFRFTKKTLILRSSSSWWSEWPVHESRCHYICIAWCGCMHILSVSICP